MHSVDTLTLSSCMACNTDFLGYGLAPYLESKLGLPASFVANMPWQERERRFDSGTIHVIWICGLPYVEKARDPSITLLAAPVRAADRYQGKAVYFSDLVVSARSPYRSFADLRGKIWSYNEPKSHSGCTTIRYYMAKRNLDVHHFDRIVMSGSHQRSLRMILDGLIDGSAIDSTVLEDEIALRPELADEIRILDSIGPSPAPPWLLNSSLPLELQDRIKQVFWTMHEDPQGRRLLEAAHIAQLVPVADSHYDPLRRMTDEASAVVFPHLEPLKPAL